MCISFCSKLYPIFTFKVNIWTEHVLVRSQNNNSQETRCQKIYGFQKYPLSTLINYDEKLIPPADEAKKTVKKLRPMLKTIGKDTYWPPSTSLLNFPDNSHLQNCSDSDCLLKKSLPCIKTEKVKPFHLKNPLKPCWFSTHF